ncbi:hypothetical protein AMS68_002954 [Peltaster fructicola]|uniref:DUF1479 domain protein n=1 Tax=Peltaster fructicola TaxID=286661 RepID=A0A6H0XRQ0_9PEZI|nr:hypothetical protein AMS68_002954 [Peltaster fructicola]
MAAHRLATPMRHARCVDTSLRALGRRSLATAVQTEKREGDISAAFASLSGLQFKPLDQRFASVKAELVKGNEQGISDSWVRLLESLQKEIPLIAEKKSGVIPQIDFKDIGSSNDHFRDELRKRGVAVVRNVLPQNEALALKDELKQYIGLNPHTKAFPQDNPQVYELYWSPSQIKARSDARLLETQRQLMSMWHSSDPDALVSTSHPAIYADRLRMRLPGDARFSLGPHVDGGSCERWEAEGYGRGHVYDKIWQGQYEQWDPWESSCRLPVRSDLYQGVGACSMFRMYQGWLAMSNTGPYEGTLLVHPLLKEATAYFLLRPFFSPRNSDPASQAFLTPENWELDLSPTNSWLHGATPGHGQELRPHLHPHLNLDESVVHMPKVNPGDYVVWHCDTIHSVDNVHRGQGDSSVMYIPTCPLTVANAQFLAQQRQRFLDGVPSPDFGGGKGESEHIGRPGVQDVEKVNAEEGMRAFGLKAWAVADAGLSRAQQNLLQQANTILGF